MGKRKQPALTLARLLRPQLSDCLVIWVLFGLCFCIPIVRRIGDADIWWHLQTGKQILANLSVPSTDPYSFTMGGKYWLAHEWLSEVIFWLIYSKFGFAGLLVHKAVMIAAIFGVVFATARGRAANLTAAAVATAVCAGASIAFWSERPQLFSYLFMAILVWLIQRSRNGGSLWPVVPMFALWINLHGGWIAGVGILLAGMAEAGWEAKTGQGNKRLMAFAKVLPFAILALFATPRPMDYVMYPFQYMGANHHTTYITEWQSPNFHKPMFFGLLLFLTGLPALLLASQRKVRPTEILFITILLAACLYSARHSAVLAIFSAPFVAESLALVRWRRSADKGRTDVAEPVLLNWVIIAILPIMTFTHLPHRGPTPYLDIKDYPVAAFKTVQARPEHGRLLTCFNWGGYAIFHLWPKYSIYIDGRADVYGADMIKRVRKLDKLQPGWQRELARTNPDLIVWPADEPLTQALEMLPSSWKRVNPKDKVAAIFVPAGKGVE